MEICKINRKIKSAFAAFILIFSCASLSALEEYVSGIYKEIDQVFVKKSDTELNAVLQKNQGDKYYYLIENYTEKKIRRLIVNDDYDFAMQAIEVVIENNLDNEQAVEMYSSIYEAYETQQKYAQEQERQKQLEIARIERLKDSKREIVNKNYVSTTKATSNSATGSASSSAYSKGTESGTASGSSSSNDKNVVYVSGKETKNTSTSWRGSFGLVNLTDLYDKDSGVNLFNYGIALAYSHVYEAQKFYLGGDLGIGLQFLDFSGSKDALPLLVDIELMPKIAFPQVFKNLFFRAGFMASKAGAAKDAEHPDAFKEAFYTPAIGIQLDNILLGSCGFSMNFDYYAGHLFYDDINVAMGGGANLALPFAEMERVKLTFNIGVKDKVFVKDNGIENRASLVLAIGAENVKK